MNEPLDTIFSTSLLDRCYDYLKDPIIYRFDIDRYLPTFFSFWKCLLQNYYYEIRIFFILKRLKFEPMNLVVSQEMLFFYKFLSHISQFLREKITKLTCTYTTTYCTYFFPPTIYPQSIVNKCILRILILFYSILNTLRYRWIKNSFNVRFTDSMS